MEAWSKEQLSFWAAHVATLRPKDCEALGSRWTGSDLALADAAGVAALGLSPDATRVLTFVASRGHWAWNGASG